MSDVKWSVVNAERVDGMGNLHPEGSYRRLEFRQIDTCASTSVVTISEGAAEELRDMLDAMAD